jgi:hypothetical protein
MKSKFVAALLSGLVFPGVGQYYLKRRGRALLFLAPAAIGGLLYFSHSLAQANAVVDQVMAGKVALDPAAISARLEAAPMPLSVTISGIVFLVSWVGSILEALLVKPPQR